MTADELDRVQGDPGLLSNMADHYLGVAESIRGAAASLRSLEAGQSSSDAVDVFVAKADELSTQLGQAVGRYDDTGSALKTYSSVLSLAQDAAGPALANHRLAADDLAAAETLMSHYEHYAFSASDEVSKQSYLDLATAQQSRAAEARVQVAIHARALDDAHASVETAAVLAIALIEDATDDGLSDSVWDDVGGAWDAGFTAFQDWMEENDAWISATLEVLSVVGFAVGLAAMFIPGLNMLVVLITAGVVLTSFMRAAAGTGSWNEFWLSTVSLVSLGIGGRLVSSSMKLTQGVRTARIEGLVETGMSPSLASSWVSKHWDRARAVRGDNFLLRAFGDESIARMTNFLRSSRAGAFVDDVDTLAAIRARLAGARVISAADQVAGAIESCRVLHKRALSMGVAQSRFFTGGSW